MQELRSKLITLQLIDDGKVPFHHLVVTELILKLAATKKRKKLSRR